MSGGRPWDDTERGRGRSVAAAFGAELRSRREAAGLTQARLAEAAGVSVSGVSALERGQRQPSLTVAFDLSRALSLRTDELARATAERLSRP